MSTNNAQPVLWAGLAITVVGSILTVWVLIALAPYPWFFGSFMLTYVGVETTAAGVRTAPGTSGS